MADVDITELIDLDAQRVAGVTNPANGTHFLVMKSEADSDDDEEKTDDEKKADSVGEKFAANKKGGGEMSDKAKAAFAANIKKAEGTPEKEGDPDGDGIPDDEDAIDFASKALSDAERDAMPNKSFAFVDKDGGKHLPIHDKGHVAAALGRFSSQKFDNADDPAAAKKKAAKKIVAAASEHGMDLDDEGTVAAAAKAIGVNEDFMKGCIQDALNGCKMPEEAGHLATAETLPWFTESMTSARALAVDTTSGLPGIPGIEGLEGGEATVTIAAESKINGPAVYNPGAYVKGKAASQLLEVMEAIERNRNAVAKGEYLSVDNAYHPNAPDMSFSEIAQNLAHCGAAIDAMLQMHAVNSALNAGDPDADIWDLQDLNSALSCALGIAAKLSFEMDAACKAQEEAGEAGEVAKAYRRLRVSDEKALRDAHSALSDVLGKHEDKAGSPANTEPSEEDKIVTEVTKSELAELVAKAARDAVKEDRKLRKQEKAEKVAKNANNGGDISEADLKPTAEVDASNIGSVSGAHTDAAALSKALDEIEELKKQVAKFAKAPKQGGPVLDGQLRQGATGSTEQVSKSEVEGEIERLEKSLADTKDPLQRDALGQALTHQKLLRFHITGQL